MTANIQRLIDIMARLRDPQSGCPWDLEQTFKSIAPHTIEETYELVEAIESGDPKSIKDELGDVLLQVVFYAQMGNEAGIFDFDGVAGHLADKLIERHPHIFGDHDAAKTAQDVRAIWEKGKSAKRAAKASDEGRNTSVLDGVTTTLPAATRAVKLQKRAASVGFDWSDARDVFAKIKEEIGELEKEVTSGAVAVAGSDPGLDPGEHTAEQSRPNKDSIEDEMGDVLFAVINLARKLDIDPEAALRSTNRKFERRFRQIEETLARQGKKITDASLLEMERIWNEIKAQEKN